MKPGSFRSVPIEKVVWGADAAEGVASEAASIGAQRVFVVASRTLARKTEEVARIRTAMGGRDAGLFDECREHTPLESVIACADAARSAKADLIVTVGGGSPIDTVKIVQLCLTHDIRTVEGLLAIKGKPMPGPSVVRQLIVPTTLSGGEYSSIAGGTDTARKMKDTYIGPDLCGRVIVLDPKIVVHTPEWLWLSTAIRALDHAVEGFIAASTNALVQATALHAMTLLSNALRQTKSAPGDAEARHQSQMGVWLAATGLGRVPMGASHGIGYLLGTMCGVPHGYTSCVMLPAVLRWDAEVIGDQDRQIAHALGRPRGSASEAVAALVGDLGLPRTLAEVGVRDDQLAEIAQRAARHPVVTGNIRPIKTPEDARQILQYAS